MEYDQISGAAYELSDPCDFDEFCRLIENGQATKIHHDEFYLRIINNFCESVQANKMPKAWVLHAISDAFFKVTMGGRWEDEFPLPWTDISLPFTRAESKDIDVFCKVANMLRSEPTLKVTEAINKAASDCSVSYEKARAAYYKYKDLIK